MSRLDHVLATLPGTIDWPEPSPHMASRVAARIEAPAPRAPRRWIWATVTALIFAVAFIPGARQAVADLIVEAGVRIGVIEEAPTAGADLDLGEEVSLSRAASVVDFPLSIPAELEAPGSIYLDGESISMVWEGDGTLPSAPGTDVAVLLTQSPGGEPRASKGVTPDSDLLTLTVDGSPALWIEGAEHTFTALDEEGNPIEETTRLAANVLLWSSDSVDFRLELTGDLETALAIANSMKET